MDDLSPELTRRQAPVNYILEGTLYISCVQPFQITFLDLVELRLPL